jgi:hypothetical protein
MSVNNHKSRRAPRVDVPGALKAVMAAIGPLPSEEARKRVLLAAAVLGGVLLQTPSSCAHCNCSCRSCSGCGDREPTP